MNPVLIGYSKLHSEVSKKCVKDVGIDLVGSRTLLHEALPSPVPCIIIGKQSTTSVAQGWMEWVAQNSD